MLCPVCSDVLKNLDQQTQADVSYILLPQECHVKTYSEHPTSEEPILETRQDKEPSVWLQVLPQD
jgi:hypothetical protein